jgi:type IV pilus biogenesis protein CpaD/CtpE
MEIILIDGLRRRAGSTTARKLPNRPVGYRLPCFALAGCADEDSNKAEMNRVDRETDVAPHEPAALDEAQQAVMNAREQRLQQNQPQ